MARRRRFDEVMLIRLREMPASEALGRLAIRMKADRSYVPVKHILRGCSGTAFEPVV